MELRCISGEEGAIIHEDYCSIQNIFACQTMMRAFKKGGGQIRPAVFGYTLKRVGDIGRRNGGKEAREARK